MHKQTIFLTSFVFVFFFDQSEDAQKKEIVSVPPALLLEFVVSYFKSQVKWSLYRILMALLNVYRFTHLQVQSDRKKLTTALKQK